MVFRVTVVVNRQKLWNFLLATKCRNCRRTVKDWCPIVSEGEVWKAAVACFRASCFVERLHRTKLSPKSVIAFVGKEVDVA